MSNYNGTAKLFLSHKNTWAHSLYNFDGDENSIAIEVITLDLFFQKRQCPIDVIKMDIEGAETEAIQGMTEIISKNNNLKLMVELSPEIIKKRSLSVESYLNQFIEYGFKIYTITSREPWIKTSSPAEIIATYPHGKGSINLFCQKQVP